MVNHVTIQTNELNFLKDHQRTIRAAPFQQYFVSEQSQLRYIFLNVEPDTSRIDESADEPEVAIIVGRCIVFDVYNRCRNRWAVIIFFSTIAMNAMKILNYTDAPSHEFDNEVARGVTGRVLIGKNDEAHNFCMRSFTLAPGGFTPRHSHAWEHEVFIHSGIGKVYKDGEWQTVTSGTAVFIPGNEEHQFMNGGAENFTFICLIPSGVDEI